MSSGFVPERVVIEDRNPRRSADFGLEPGLTALYGRNGEGKTVLLDSLTNTLRGAGSGYLVGRAGSDVSGLIRSINQEREKWLDVYSLEPHVVSDDVLWHSAGRSELDRALGDWLAERWLYSGSTLDWGSSSTARPGEVVDEVVKHHKLIARPTRERFDLHLAVYVGSATPILRSLLNPIRDTWEGFLTAAGAVRDDTNRIHLAEEATELWRDEWSGRFHPQWFFTVFGGLPDAAATWFGDTDTREDEDEDDAWIAVPRALNAQEFDLALQRLFRGEILLELTLERDPHNRLAASHERQFSVTTNSDLETTDPTGRTLKLLSGVQYDVATEDGEDVTRQDMSDRRFVEVVDGQAVAASWASECCARVASDATELLRRLLPDAPQLRCKITNPESWVELRPVRWSAIDRFGSSISLDDLSGAQSRLAGYALELTLSRHLRSSGAPVDSLEELEYAFGGARLPQVFVLDEPETGLHGLAERNLARVLHEYAIENEICMFVATHSRHLLGMRQIRRQQVYRDTEGTVRTRLIDFPEDYRPEDLGIEAGDLLSMTQAVLLVEGHHDEIVLDELIGPELKRRGVLTVPMGGAKNLKNVVDLEILAKTLSVPVVAMLDNTRTARFDRLWEQLRVLKGQDSAAAAAVFTQFEDGDLAGWNLTDEELADWELTDWELTYEEKVIVALVRRLYDMGQLQRFTVFGLEVADIPEYLPVERFVPNAETWEDLHDEHRLDKEAGVQDS